MALIAASPHVVKGGEIQKDAKGYIDVIEKEGKVPTPRRYSNLQGVVVRDRSITGKIDVVDLVPQGVGKQLEPSDKARREGAIFRTNIDPNGQFREQFVKALADNN